MEVLLHRLVEWLLPWWHRLHGALPSGLPASIAPDEDLARFLTQSNLFSASQVKPAAFMASPNTRETSVSRHGREPAERLWRLGGAAAGHRTLYGAAILKASAMAPPLVVEADEPPPCHAAIRGWPSDPDPELQKAQRRALAAVLAAAAGPPVLRPPTEVQAGDT